MKAERHNVIREKITRWGVLPHNRSKKAPQKALTFEE
jgi:hypothetical protein